ncbi:caspase family protein [Catenulispora subtropica]|uniref:Peptidase C14 caspase domain-containing protein n=1 Tax=Catenulispora subtropica TaxID=450798 RepID=A0ABP5EHT6_9ACTN
MSLYALVVGIDAYQPPLNELRGARHDALAVESHLRSRIPAKELDLLSLIDGKATRDAVISGFRGHLAQAGPGDTALFWFSGHGSWLPVPPELAHLESTGMFQTLLCVDSRQGSVPDLIDKELALLIADVAAGGAHVAVVLDCCHADSGSRRPDFGAYDHVPGIRSSPPSLVPPAVEALLEELRDQIGPDSPRAKVFDSVDHVLLAACGPHELALELRLGDHYRGVFTTALLDRLTQYPGATYRQLLDDTGNLVEQMAPYQHPTLFPARAVPGGTLADQPFLGGPARVPQTSMTMRFANRVWTLDAGAAHGIEPGTEADPTVVAVHSSRPPLKARVVEVRAEHSVLEPIGWSPDALDRRTGHPVVLARVPLPAEAVRLETAAAGEYVRPLIARTLAAAGEDGVPSPYARVFDPADRTRPPTIRIRAVGPGVVQLCRADGGALAPPHPCRSPEQAARLVTDLEHIARWRLVEGLDNPVSPLAGAIEIELAAVPPGQDVDRLTAPPLPVGADGGVTVDYHPTRDGGWQAPRVFVRLRNTADRMLYCVLLDLTERFRVHAELFPGDWIGARRTASVLRGRAVRLSLPSGAAVEPGARTADRFKVLISETPLNERPFMLPRLGELRPSEPVSSRVGLLNGVLDRLGFLATHRDADPAEPGVVGDWATATVRVTVRVPRVPGRDPA